MYVFNNDCSCRMEEAKQIPVHMTNPNVHQPVNRYPLRLEILTRIGGTDLGSGIGYNYYARVVQRMPNSTAAVQRYRPI